MGTRLTLTRRRFAAVVLSALLVGGAFGGAFSAMLQESPDEPARDDAESFQRTASVEAFDSAGDFRSYLREADRGDGAHLAGAGGGTRAMEASAGAPREADDRAAGAATATAVQADAAATHATSGGDAGGGGGGATPRRASDTNVQEAGIDEPDRLKTTRDTLFYAGDSGRVVHEPRPRTTDRARTDDRGHERRWREPQTTLIDASDPAAPAVAARLNVSGKLLLAGDTLVVLGDGRLYGYDVSDRTDPRRRWSKSFSGDVVTARLHQGHVYLVTAERIDESRPCPVEPVEGGEVACTGIHHPSEPVPVDRTYVVTVLDPDTGTVDDTAGFVGTARQSAVYMSENGVYLTYTKQVSQSDLLLEFFLSNQSDRLNDSALAHLREVASYDLSDRARSYEVMATYRSWLASLDADRRERVRREVRDELRRWAAAHKREFHTTGVVEFRLRHADTETPSVEPGDVGSVPGRPLDQFSLDEHEGHLRIATTVPGAMGSESENDVYVLDGSLDVVGSVTGMGVTERIYSVRFAGDEAYVVTFRRIDPFHVLDLSEPTDPTLEGELKLPGYSSYLHPLSEDRVLGIGEEDGRVKLVVFDVSDPTDPTIADSRVLDARWSAVARSHHAFLQDRRHGVFFLPTADAGYVYRYEDGLERVATVEVRGRATRAAYVGDYLYVFGEDSLTVVDETTWNRTDTLDLR